MFSTIDQKYDSTGNINQIRKLIDQWRMIPNPSDWKVTPETARLLNHWRNYPFSGLRPFFCQVEAIETLIWLTEVAPQSGKKEKDLLERLKDANNEANPDLFRIASRILISAARL